MSKSKFGNDNRAIAKFNERVVVAEKQLNHRRLRAKALCTHTKRPMEPALAYKEENGQLKWICKICGENVDLTRIPDEELKKAIATVSQACNLIKIMSRGTEREQKIIETVIADIQLKVNAYLYDAYKGALNMSKKAGNQNNRRRRNSIIWES